MAKQGSFQNVRLGQYSKINSENQMNILLDAAKRYKLIKCIFIIKKTHLSQN